MAIDRERIVLTTCDSEQIIDVPPHDPFVDEFRDFYGAVVAGKEFVASPESALQDLRFVEAALLSADRDESVTLGGVEV